MIKPLIATLSFITCAALSVSAQVMNVSKSIHVGDGYFNHLDVSASIGSPGIGIDLSTPIGEYVNLRLGMTYMPQIEVSSSFRVQVGDSLEHKYDIHGNRVETKFDRLSYLLKSFVGYDVDDEVDMMIKPTYYNARLLVDFLPFRDKRWHLTAGFYVGPSEIGRAKNSTEDMPSLMAVNLYNMMYDRLMADKPLFSFGDQSFDVPPEFRIKESFMYYGRMGVHVGDHLKDGPILYIKDAKPEDYEEDGTPIYSWDDDGNPIHEPVILDANGNPKLAYYKGDPYMMVPGEEDGMVRVVSKVNRKFKPYVGFGYGGTISKDGRTELSFDAGVLFWGGKPHVYTHEGIDLVYDVENIKGKVGNYVSLIKKFPVFPVLELRVTRRIF